MVEKAGVAVLLSISSSAKGLKVDDLDVDCWSGSASGSGSLAHSLGKVMSSGCSRVLSLVLLSSVSAKDGVGREDELCAADAGSEPREKGFC